jgi:replicative DNA helicase
LKLFDTTLEVLAIRTVLQSERGGLPLFSRVRNEFFGSDATKEIMARIQIMVNNGKGIPNIELLRQDPAISEESRILLQTQVEPLQTEEDIDTCVDRLNGFRNARILYETIKKSTELMSVPDPKFEDVVMLLENSVLKCRSTIEKSEMEHIMDTDPDTYMKTVEETLSSTAEDFIPSGFAWFDKEYGGFNRGNVLLLAAPSGKGKSAMMLRMAILQYMMGLNVLVVSFEMTNKELRERLLSSVSKVQHQDIRLKRLLDQQKDAIRKGVRDFIQTGYGNKITLWGTSENLDVNDISAITKTMGYDAIYIDYLGLLKANPNKQQHEVLGELTRDAKRMAKQNDCLVVPLAQLDDESLKIKYSKAIKANCDFIWAWELNPKETEMGVLEIKQYKVRHGPEVPFYLRIDLSRMLFADYDGPEVNLKMDPPKQPMPKMNIGQQ